jgi:hypothetical protein
MKNRELSSERSSSSKSTRLFHLCQYNEKEIIPSSNTSSALIFVKCGRTELNRRESSVDDVYIFYLTVVHRLNVLLLYLENPSRMKVKNSSEHLLLRTH